ncbi:dTDP-glucose 4,6-dehydratase [Liquorilactobacillus sucicola DSM 21376 = JCM 15457]|nr:dTDP-glucose 4,6-dehydratase [Liquorilactobacillus sucicola DSM 21376 = JCM 15457]
MNIVRCSNNYGPFQFPEKLIPLLITKGIVGQKLPIYGDGQNIRDWLHVSDHCRAIDLVLHKGEEGEVYNVGGHNERTNNEIAALIIAELKLDKSVIAYVRDRLGHDRRYAMDPTKIETKLGWKPEYTFDSGIQETIRWYLQNVKWWSPLQNKAEIN